MQNKMTNTVILLAGGKGERMGAPIPKQFIEVNSQPIIIHTLKKLSSHPLVDQILIVCIRDWIGYVEGLVKKYHIAKVKWVIEGGESSHDSIRNGVFFLRDKVDSDSYVIIHDAVRPIIDEKLLSSVIETGRLHGNASSAIVSHPPVVLTYDHKSSVLEINRENVMLTASPQVYRYQLVHKYYVMADQDNIHNTTFTSSLLIHYGERIYFAKGSSHNIKITTEEDLELFKALLKIYDK